MSHVTCHKPETKLLVIVWLMSAAVSIGAADPSTEEKIKSIRAQYAQIEKGLKDCRLVKRELSGESAEGGELKGYFKDRSVEKLSATFFGETGKALEEYYFWNSELIFVLRVESHYTKPMSGVVKPKTEERLYFAEGRLIRWLDAEKKDVTASPEKSARERDFLASAKKYSALVSQ